MKKIILLLVSMLVSFAACEKPDSNTSPKKEDQEQGQEQQSESDIAKQALSVLKQAGIDVPASDIKYQGVIRTAKRDLSSDKFIGYYQICCVKSTWKKRARVTPAPVFSTADVRSLDIGLGSTIDGNVIPYGECACTYRNKKNRHGETG